MSHLRKRTHRGLRSLLGRIVLLAVGGADGLDFYRRLAAEAPRFLQPGAPVLLEFGDGQEDDLRRLFSGPGWVFEAIENDLSGRPRIVIARRAT